MIDQPDHEDSTTFIHAQDETAGVMSALVKYVPKLIVSCGVAVGIAIGGYDHFKEKADTQEVWKHSGEWRSEWTQQDISRQYATNYLEGQIQDLQAQINQLREGQNTKGK